MFVDFERIFNPTIEERIKDLETRLRIHNEAIRKKWCSTCKHWKAPPDNLPGFVDNHGDCTFNHTVDATPKCADYDFDETSETDEYERIKNELERLRKSGN